LYKSYNLVAPYIAQDKAINTRFKGQSKALNQVIATDNNPTQEAAVFAAIAVAQNKAGRVINILDNQSKP